MICTATNMVVEIEQLHSVGLHKDYLRLNDPACTLNSNGTHVLANISLNACGTMIEVKLFSWAQKKISLSNVCHQLLILVSFQTHFVSHLPWNTHQNFSSPNNESRKKHHKSIIYGPYDLICGIFWCFFGNKYLPLLLYGKQKLRYSDWNGIGVFKSLI